MEEIQRTMEQMSTYMNIIAIITTILLCIFLLIIFFLIFCTAFDGIKAWCKQKAADKKAAESNTQNALDSSLTEKEKSQSSDCDLKNFK